MERIELLLPAGDRESLRAAVANGADAVYLGTESFNARRFATNFSMGSLPDAVSFCHRNDVRVYVTANILVKNRELEVFFKLVNAIGQSKADAIILQDPCLVPLVRECAPDLEIHLSTQATTTNRYAVPDGVDRVIVPREMGLDQISAMAKSVPVEMFVHGALCLSYSGQCLFSSIAGGRSGNRGRCAQPCRYKYNGEYPLSTKDLCLVEKLPEIIKTGVSALKVEGRMRGPTYTGVVARIYRKYIDLCYAGDFRVDPRDIEELKMAFNRDFTTGFAFNGSVVDARYPLNRGLYLGTLEKGKIRLETGLRTGDGVTGFHEGEKSGNTARRIRKEGAWVDRAVKGDTVTIEVKGATDGDQVYKTFSSELKVDLGADFALKERSVPVGKFKLPAMEEKTVDGPPELFVKVHNIEGAKEADSSGASVIYYDIFREGIESVRGAVRNARFFVSTPRVMSEQEVEKASEVIGRLRPDGVLVGERGLLSMLGKTRSPKEIHLDVSFNVFNDIDLAAYGGVPIISPELTLDELAGFHSKRFIVMAHGPLVLMSAREPLKEGTLCDEDARKFRVRRAGGLTEVLNCSELGLFNKARAFLDAGIKWFFLDLERNVGRTVGTYRKILSGRPFNDRRIRHGYTTGHFGRGVE
jgi:putative protease